MNDKTNTDSLKFELLCKKYVYPLAPNTNDELIEFWSAGIAAAAENPDDINILERISKHMQEHARNSTLYNKYSVLEEINDDLLRFEDMDSLSENEAASIAGWHTYMSTLINRTKAAIDY